MYEAYVRVGVGIATLLNYAGPMLVLASSPFLFGERWTRPLLISVVMVICGMVCLNQNVAGGSLDFIGLLCGILSAVMYAAMVILTKKAIRISGLSATLLTLLGASVVVTAFVLAKQGTLPTVLPEDYLPVAMLGIVNTGFTCYLYFSSMQKLPVRTVSVCGYIEPISAVVFSMILLGEVMSSAQLIGGALVLGGAVYGEYSARKRS
jgi:drug/metabolite transporter (DMT)-like permease